MKDIRKTDIIKALENGTAIKMRFTGKSPIFTHDGKEITEGIAIFGEIFVLDGDLGWLWLASDDSPLFEKIEEEVIDDKTVFNEGALQEELNAKAMINTKLLLKLLSAGLSTKTKIMTVPVGTMVWRFEVKRSYLSYGYETIQVPLYRFFGMYVGYNVEFDILVCWTPK